MTKCQYIQNKKPRKTLSFCHYIILHTSTQVAFGQSCSSCFIESSIALFELPQAGNTVSNLLSETSKNTSKLSDAQDALVVLGYSRNEALKALQTIDTNSLELDDIIRLALKKLMK